MRGLRSFAEALGLGVLLALAATPLSGRAAASSEDFTDMKLEDLLHMEVLSASKKSEALSETTAAVYVITADDIWRSGFTTLPEVLRLVPGMDVSRVTSNTWSLSARGFDNQFANKLLVLMDGRSLYTPLFAGVFWDDHDIALDDVERIEVIRGPGGAIWGANAVNGVINIITRSSHTTHGNQARAIVGTEDKLISSFRHGAELSKDASVRVWGRYANRDETIFRDHSQAHDEWRNGRSGLRADWQRGERDFFTFDGELHASDTRLPLQIDDALNLALGLGSKAQLYDTIHSRGGLGRLGWKRALGPDSSFELAGYVDRRDRTAHDHFSEKRAAYDLTLQHRFPFGDGHDVVWGGGYRLNRDRIENTPNLRLGRDDAQDVVYSVFAQDDVAVSERLKLTLGSKFEWNDYTGWEVQPSARALYAFAESHAVWAAVSRAVRTPNRSQVDLDELLFLSVPAGLSGCPGSFFLLDPACHASLVGNEDYKSEIVVAYELGWRVRPVEDVSLDVAAFFNDYENLQSFRPTPSDPLAQQVINGSEAFTYGLEASARWFANEWWRLGFTYTGLQIQENGIRRNMGIEGQSPHHQFRVSSSMNLPGALELDTHVYYTGRRSAESFMAFPTDSHWRLDTVLGWQLRAGVHARLVAQDLLTRRHTEHSAFVVFAPQQAQVQRAFYGQLSFDF